MGKNQFEDNATNALVLILRGNNKAKARLIFDFLVSKCNPKPKFEDVDYFSTRESTTDQTKPDITIHYKNNKFNDYHIEVKDKNSALTDSEKNPKSRDVFLIPDDYKHEKDIKSEILYWKDLFEKIDTEFGGECFDELKLTRASLWIKESGSFDAYVAKALKLFCYLAKDYEEIKFEAFDEYFIQDENQGFWISIEISPTAIDNYILLSFEKEDVLIEWQKLNKNDSFTKTATAKLEKDHYEHFQNQYVHTYCKKIANRSDFMKMAILDNYKKTEEFKEFEEIIIKEFNKLRAIYEECN